MDRLTASSAHLLPTADLEVLLGILICAGGIIFLMNLGGLASRWEASRLGRRGQPSSPQERELHAKLLHWRHWVTVVLGLILVVIGLVGLH